MLNRVLLVVVIVPIAVILIALAVANRAPAAFTIDPFNPGNPALTLQLPLFVFLFLMLAVGMVIGSVATWLKQGHYRKEARQQRREVQNLLQQARSSKEGQKQAAAVAGPGLPAPRT